jgi:hypothetical protein
MAIASIRVLTFCYCDDVDFVLPCPVLPCPALPCPVLSCPALPCPALPCPVLSCPVLSCLSLGQKAAEAQTQEGGDSAAAAAAASAGMPGLSDSSILGVRELCAAAGTETETEPEPETVFSCTGGKPQFRKIAESGIDTEMLKQRQDILFYDEIILYEVLCASAVC